MRIRIKDNRAVVTLGRHTLWGGKEAEPDARSLHAEMRATREEIRAYCEKKGLAGYSVYASAAYGGCELESFDFPSPSVSRAEVRAEYDV